MAYDTARHLQPLMTILIYDRVRLAQQALHISTHNTRGNEPLYRIWGKSRYPAIHYMILRTWLDADKGPISRVLRT